MILLFCILLCIMYRDVPSYVSSFFITIFFFVFVPLLSSRDFRLGVRCIRVVLQLTYTVIRHYSYIIMLVYCFNFFVTPRRSEYLLKFNNDISHVPDYGEIPFHNGKKDTSLNRYAKRLLLLLIFFFVIVWSVCSSSGKKAKFFFTCTRFPSLSSQ